MMDCFTRESVKEIYGLNFRKYCSKNNILMKRDEQEAFLLPDQQALTTCILATKSFKSNMNRKFRHMQKYALSKNFPCYKNKLLQSVHKQYERNKNKQTNIQKISKVPQTCLDDSHLHIYIKGTTPIVPTYKSPVKHLLTTKKNGRQLYKFIIKKVIPELSVLDYHIALPVISPLLDEFREKHQYVDYNSILKDVMQKERPSKFSKCEYEVTKRQLKTFFNIIFFKVVPMKIFGKIRNLKKIKKTLFDFLYVPYFKPFSLMPLLDKLDIHCVTWLNDIKSDDIKQSILAKFIKWLFTGFLLRILYIHFHITTVSTTSTERIYIARYKWNTIQHEFIRQKKISYGLQPDIVCKEWYPSIGRYKLLPKHSDFRPIFIPWYPKKEKDNLWVIFTFLRQLHITEYGSHSFEQKWKAIVKYKRESEIQQLYFVCCDVMNAFGSIIQDKLYGIIKTLSEKLPEELILKFYAVESKKFKDEIVCYKHYFADPHLKLPLEPGKFYTKANLKFNRCINKALFLQQIEKQIFGQRVKIGKNNYIIGRGIVQGTMLSPILSDIYYNFMLHEEMKMFLKAGEIIKYMDDILYVTKDKILAKKFLELTHEGIPKYNCFFKKGKTQSNVAYNGNKITNNIFYIGYKINCTTLQIEPKEKNIDLCYTISLAIKDNVSPLKLLLLRLNNLSALNISRFILDLRVNSKKTIMKILKTKSLMQAKRASFLIKELFTNIKVNAQCIHDVIKMTNSRLAIYIVQAIAFRKRMKKLYIYKWNITILNILWNSYKKVFEKDPILKRHFSRIIKFSKRK